MEGGVGKNLRRNGRENYIQDILYEKKLFNKGKNSKLIKCIILIFTWMKEAL